MSSAIAFPLAARQRQNLLPGLGLSIVVAVAAELAERLEMRVFGRAWLEALVLAIVLGAAVAHFLPKRDRFRPGIAWSAKFPLETAIVLIGASISVEAIAGSGPAFVVLVAALVALGIAGGLGIGRLLGLDRKVALLVACGNSICGNSAIAAVAPVISADGDDVASAIAFTAVLGVAAVLLLPVLGGLLSLTPRGYGILAGLTVYAVPQVIAATAPVSSLSLAMGTVTKLVRVLMLGPAIFAIALFARSGGATRPRLGHLLPWYIVGFLAAMGLRSFGLVPVAVEAPVGAVANILTVLAMAALGLSVDLRAVLSTGGRVMAAATLSLLGLGVLAYGVVRLLA